MKIILINPPMDFAVALGKAKGIAKYTAMMPSGLAYMAALLKKNNLDVQIIDAYSLGLSIERIVSQIDAAGTDIVGISCVTPTVPTVLSIAKRLKELNKNILAVIGGFHASALPEDLLQYEYIDVVVRGEGETTFMELVEAFRQKKSFSPIEGISFKENGGFIHNKNRSLFVDLDSLPLPAYELLPFHLYKAPPHWAVKEPVAFIQISRGCPFNCTFCAVEILGKKRRLRSMDSIFKEIDFLIEKFNARQIMFQDPDFPVERKYALEFCNEAIKRGYSKRIVWTTSTRVDLVDEELLNKMYESGCRIVNYGIESGVQEILDNVKKGFTVEKARKSIKASSKSGIKNFATFIFGLPGDSRKTILDTLKFAKELDVDFAQFYILVPYPGTALYKMLKKENKLPQRNWDDFLAMSSMTGIDPIFVPEGMTESELKQLQKMAYHQYYFRPRMMLRHLGNIHSVQDVVRYFDVAKALLSI